MSGKAITIPAGPNDSKEVLLSLIERDINFFSFIDPEAQLANIKDIFAPDIVWYDFDGTIEHGYDGLLKRSTFLINALTGYVHRAAGKASVCQKLVTGGWEVVPEGTEDDHNQVPVIQGRDVLLVENGKIKILWSCVDRMDKVLLPRFEKA